MGRAGCLGAQNLRRPEPPVLQCRDSLSRNRVGLTPPNRSSFTDAVGRITLNPCLLDGSHPYWKRGQQRYQGESFAADILLHECLHSLLRSRGIPEPRGTDHNSEPWAAEVERLGPLLGFGLIQARPVNTTHVNGKAVTRPHDGFLSRRQLAQCHPSPPLPTTTTLAASPSSRLHRRRPGTQPARPARPRLGGRRPGQQSSHRHPRRVAGGHRHTVSRPNTPLPVSPRRSPQRRPHHTARVQNRQQPRHTARPGSPRRSHPPHRGRYRPLTWTFSRSPNGIRTRVPTLRE